MQNYKHGGHTIWDCKYHAGSINWNHVHMLIGIPPSLSVSKAVQFLKGKSSQ